MSNELRILILEDVPTDAELMERELRKAGLAFSARRVETRTAFVQALADFAPAVILADYNLPEFDGLAALAIAREQVPDVSFLFVTGSLGEERAVEALKQGATDYILKDRMTRLGPAVQRALEESAQRTRLRHTEEIFRKLTNAAQDAIVMVDDHGKIIYWSRAAETLYGYTAEQAVTQPLHNLIVPERFRAEAGQGFGRFVETGAGPVVGKAIELMALRRDGTEFPAEHSIAAVRVDGHWCAIGIVRDISERKAAEHRLQEQLDELRRFQNVAIGRELRMKALVEENERLKTRMAELTNGNR